MEGVEGKGGGEAEEEERIHPVLSLLYFTPVYCKPYAVYSLLSSVYSSNILIILAAISIFTALLYTAIHWAALSSKEQSLSFLEALCEEWMFRVQLYATLYTAALGAV